MARGLELVALLTAGGAGAASIKVVELVLGRGPTRANTGAVQAQTRMTDQQAAASEVGMLREVIAEVRASEAKKAERIDNLERRLDLLEERERHMLTRAAVHEAWDQMAFALLSQMNPDHPPPPPLELDHNHDV